MSRSVLFFAWEYHGYNSKQTVALSRRITHVAESFNANGWEVNVVHKDHLGECGGRPFIIKVEKNGVRRAVVKHSYHVSPLKHSPVLRAIEDVYYVTFRGDRAYEWAKDVIKCYSHLGIQKPDLIISFFTPKAPLYLGNYFSKLLGVPWVADLQDNLSVGVTPRLEKGNRRWLHKTLSTARAITHVSPEWAAYDGNKYNVKITTLRHAIPAPDHPFVTQAKPADGLYRIFYGGTLNVDDQSIAVLKQVLQQGRFSKKPCLVLACADNTYEFLNRELGHFANIEYRGWLGDEGLEVAILESDCLMVIPWSSPGRQVIPSKFYEYCAYPKPIWIPGNDTGSFAILMAEWQHPPIDLSNLTTQSSALQKAMKGDSSGMFQTAACKGEMLTTADLCKKFVSLAGMAH